MGLVNVTNLKKSEGDFAAVNGIDFSIKLSKQGEAFDFLGPSGAGKTSATNMFIGLSRPTEGGICIDGIGTEKYPKKA